MYVCRRVPRLFVVATLLSVAPVSIAQSASPRIRGPIEAKPSGLLPGSLDPHVRDAEDMGAVPDETTIPGITLTLSRSPEQQAALDQLLTDQMNPASPLYHQWLTPDQFAARFGPAPADVASVEQWLQARGFKLDATADSSGRITFSGTASEVRQAFGAELHRFRSGEEVHMAPAGALSVPAALAPVTSAVLHLSDFRPKPNVRAHPNYTTSTTQSHFLTPADVITMYDYGPLAANNYGSSQSLAVVGQSYVPTIGLPAVDQFLSAARIILGGYRTQVLVPGSGSAAIFPGDEGESEIDLEYSSSMIPGARIYFVYTGANSNYGVWDALAFAITRDISPVISVSYGECEPLLSPSFVQWFNGLFQQGAAQGQTIVASSGDQGATTCIVNGTSSGLSTAQLQGLAVQFPASSPLVTGVGGTQMAPGTFTAGPSSYWNPATTTDLISSLTGYVPEVAWNEDSSAAIISSTGGSSILYSRPSWQTGVPGIPSGSFRLVPDIALQSSVADPGYVICTYDKALGGDSSDCAGLSFRNSSGNYILSGGTSFAAPIFASFVAALNVYEQSNGQGNLNPVLYSLAAQPATYASVFHDIMIGSTACLAGQPLCGAAGESGFTATFGYDQATGLGSLDFAKLLEAWPVSPSKSLIPTFVEIGNPSLQANPGAPVTLPIFVYEGAGSAPGASGSVSLMIDGGPPISIQLNTPLNIIGAPGTLSQATYTFNAPASTGSHIVSVNYPGDSIHSGSSNTFSIMVGNIWAPGGFTLAANNLNLSANGTGTTLMTITPSGGYNGALTWSSRASGTTAQTICYFVVSPAVISGPVTATVHIGVGTACNSPTAGHLLQASPVQRTEVDRPSSRLLHYVSGTAATPVLAILLCGLLPRRSRKPLPVLAVLLLSVVPIALSGCGGGSGSGGTNSGSATGQTGGSTTPGSQVYTVTMTGTDSVQTSITASTTFTLTVN